MLSGLHQIRKLKIFGAILALSFAFISAHPVFAEVDLELSVAPTLQVVIPASTISLNLTPNPDPSKSVFASENLTVSVATNNPTGYSLILKADSTNLTNTVEDRNGDYSVLSTLTDLEGGYTEETFTVNRWGYRNHNTILNNAAASTVPGNYNAFTTSSEILSSKLPTNLDQTSLDFAAKVDITQPAGTYELALDFTAVTNMVPGVVTITYEPNTGIGQMPVQQIEAGTSQNLIPNTFTKANYIFMGWNTEPDGTGTHYDNEQSYETVLDVANKSVTLYAQWELDVKDLGIMQEITPDILSTLSEDTIYAATDSRDNTRYLLGKLKDGNLWMIQNLRLGEKADTYNLTAADSDTNGDFTLNGKSSDGIFTYGTNSGFNYTNDSSQFYCTEDYGCYYNWYAATVGSGTSATTSGNAGYSLCPKGWTLPIGGAGGQFEALAAAYNNSAIEMLVTPTTLTENTNGDKPGLILGGAYSGSGATSVGTYGSYWSRTALSGQYGYLLGLNATAINPANSANKYNGRLSRCVLNTQTISDVTYMQDVTPTIAANTPVGMEATLKDNRDQEEYLIGKLADGKLWMLDNLRLGSTTTTALTPENTNIALNWTLPASGTANFTSSAGYTTAAINATYKNSTTTTYGNGSGKVGVYYNYCAATAGTYCYAEGASTGNASYDICPKNWRMPTGGSSGEYQALFATYSSNETNFRAALSTPLSGLFYNASQGFLGLDGHFWSSTYAGGGSSMYLLYVSSSNVYPAANSGRSDGRSVRCVLK